MNKVLQPNPMLLKVSLLDHVNWFSITKECHNILLDLLEDEFDVGCRRTRICDTLLMIDGRDDVVSVIHNFPFKDGRIDVLCRTEINGKPKYYYKNTKVLRKL